MACRRNPTQLSEATSTMPLLNHLICDLGQTTIDHCKELYSRRVSIKEPIAMRIRQRKHHYAFRILTYRIEEHNKNKHGCLFRVQCPQHDSSANQRVQGARAQTNECSSVEVVWSICNTMLCSALLRRAHILFTCRSIQPQSARAQKHNCNGNIDNLLPEIHEKIVQATTAEELRRRQWLKTEIHHK